MDLKPLHLMEFRPADTSLIDTMQQVSLYNSINILISQFRLSTCHTSLDNPKVKYYPESRTLELYYLVFNFADAIPGKYALCAAIEITDFVVEDGEGNKTILPDSLEDEASVYRDDPVVLGTTPGDTIVVTIYNTTPITQQVGFTATGRERIQTGQVKRKEIDFLRWENGPQTQGFQVPDLLETINGYSRKISAHCTDRENRSLHD